MLRRICCDEILDDFSLANVKQLIIVLFYIKTFSKRIEILLIINGTHINNRLFFV